MSTPKEEKTSPSKPRWVCRLIGVTFLAYAAYAIVLGEITERFQKKYEIVIRMTDQPWRFWIVVGALAFAGLVFTVVGFMRGGDDAA